MDDAILEYLTNPVYFSELSKRSHTSPKDVGREIIFYRRRLISLYKDLLSGERINQTLNEAHDHFVRLAIEHFKCVDTEDVLQQEYDGLENEPISTPKIEDEPNKDSADTFLMTTKEVAVPTLEDFVVSSKQQTSNITPPPQRRIVNLKDEQFRDKGVPKKQVSIHEV